MHRSVLGIRFARFMGVAVENDCRIYDVGVVEKRGLQTRLRFGLGADT